MILQNRIVIHERKCKMQDLFFLSAHILLSVAVPVQSVILFNRERRRLVRNFNNTQVFLILEECYLIQRKYRIHFASRDQNLLRHLPVAN